jgi:CubicO group peptidase (beta-lactamase class C family)
MFQNVTLRLLLAGLLTVSMPVLATGDPEPSGGGVEELLGLWQGERHFGPPYWTETVGTLVLERHDSQWRAEIVGLRVPVEVEGATLAFTLPGDQGRFQGRFEGPGKTIHGQWIQPGGISTFGQRFSTPVHLEPSTSGDRQGWHGRVAPLPDRLRIFLQIERGEGETVRAFVRNPENNFGRMVDLAAVRRTGETVEFLGNFVWQKEAEPQVLLEGRYRAEPDLLSIFLEDFGGTYDLHRVGAGDPSDALPRAGVGEPYRYHPPLGRADGWKTGTLKGAGMAVAPVEALVREIAGTSLTAVDTPYIQALLVARHGRLVVEEYFHGTAAETPHDIRSASKSLTGVLAGAAIHRGLVSLETPVYATFHGGVVPDGTAQDSLDPRAARMTLEDLLTMRSGLACDDWDGDSPGGEDRMQSQRQQPDWYRYILDLPMLHEPGEHGAYCSGGMNLAGGVMARAAGRPLTELFDTLLGRPLGLGPYHTNLQPTGEAYAGGGLRITGRDLLKFGQLMLDDGVWNGRRILPEGWAAEALRPRHTLGSRRPEGYGYGWWRLTYERGGRSWDAFYAGGNGGNYLIGIPELDLVVVFLASNYGQSVQHDTKYEAVPRYLLESVLQGAATPAAAR